MFNPYDYDDSNVINRPKLSDETIRSVISGTKESAVYLSNLLINKTNEKSGNNIILALDGYVSAQWEQTVNLISQNLKLESKKVTAINFAEIFKTSEQLDVEFSGCLEVDREKDPVLLFGKLFEGTYEDLLDNHKIDNLKKKLEQVKSRNNKGEVIIVYGCGCAIKIFRPLYDYILYFDVTPKKVILRARNGFFPNLGDSVPRPIKELLRRFYYVDFEVAAKLRWDLIRNNAIDYYIASDDPGKIQLIPREALSSIMSALVKYPMQCKPVYLEGVWGGQYIKKLRNLPVNMRNCAWVFDLIPLEVSIVVEAGSNKLEFPFFTFVQKEGIELMGKDCVKKFGGYFPLRFNYDDTWHSSGNMSIQVHSGHDYNVNNYNELGTQDESYYVVATGHGARTFVGFNEDTDTEEFIREIKKSEKEYTAVDYEKYVSHILSKPGIQIMLPAGTIHSSGRNQVVLEIGSLTIGSYTYKMYDYLRADLDGIPRPIHSWHGERVLCKGRTASWVKENLVQQPVLVRKGEGWAEYIIGEHELLYFSLRRLEFEKAIEDNTYGKFHVLTLVDGEKVVVQSNNHPELCYTQNYLDIIIIPANMGKYTIKNMGNQPICIHKTMLKDGFINDRS
ncbi:MAG: phosphoheptose isomerase [Bacteroidetes bacterium]|nr:MAG: phosphoheptose isomerase [Bacteroidota bacterium]